MKRLEIKIDSKTSAAITELFDSLAKDFKSVMPNTVAAFDKSVEYAANRWRGWTMGKNGLDNIPPHDKPSAKLAESVKVTTNGELDATISSSHPEMSKIVEGQQESTFDMKTKYPYGRKSRLSKKNIPYLIIPFRWGTPNKNNEARAHFANFIPQVVYQENVKGMKMSSRLSTTHREENFKGEMIERSEYNWGSRLRNTWHKNAENMVRMKDAAGKSTYFTFRIISANSPADSWIRKYPKIEGIDIMEALKRDVEPVIERFIERGIKADLGQ